MYRIKLVWVLGRMGIDGNEITDLLAIQGSSYPLTGPECALGISAKVSREVIRDWKSRKQRWQSVCGQRQAKGFLKKLLQKKLGNSSI
jgi:hypothetical protein